MIPFISGDCSGDGSGAPTPAPAAPGPEAAAAADASVGDIGCAGAKSGLCGGVGTVVTKLSSFWNVVIGSPIGVGGSEYGLIDDGAGDGGFGSGFDGGGTGEGALRMRRRRLMRRLGRDDVGVGATGAGAGGGGSGPSGGGFGGMGEAGMVGSAGLPLLWLRRWPGLASGAIMTSSGRGGRAEEGGEVAGGANEKRPARNENDSLKVVFVTGAECGGRVG